MTKSLAFNFVQKHFIAVINQYCANLRFEGKNTSHILTCFISVCLPSLLPSCIPKRWKFWLEVKTDTSASLPKVSVSVFHVFCRLSVWWGKRARSTWAGYVELIASCKKALSQMWFHKTPLFPRTKMHTVDWRTKRGTSCGARCANPDCRARQTNYVKKKYVQGSIVTIQLLGAAVARRFAREGLTVAVARYLGAHTSYLCFVWCASSEMEKT